jgi:hypothetical protein
VDADRFDGVVRTLALSGSRRGALGALLGGALGLLGLTAPAAGRKSKRKPNREHNREKPGNDRKHSRQKRDRRDNGKPKDKRKKHGDKATAQGPCGDGGARANTCKRDGQCCTGYCDKKNDRCRCKKLNESCTEDRNCCATSGQPMTCQSGTCQTVPGAPPPTPVQPTQESPPPGCTPTCEPNVCGSGAPDGCGSVMDCGGCAGGQACVANVCITCTTHSQCGAGVLCHDGVCHSCTVSCPSGNPAACGAALQEALDDGGTIYICPGTYQPPESGGIAGFVITKNGVSVIGAGQDADPTANTILDSGTAANARLILNRGGTTGNPVTLANLHITGGRTTGLFFGAMGVENREPGVLEMTDCTVTGNGGAIGGAAVGNGIGGAPVTLTMTRCTITDNDNGDGFGGGIRNLGTVELDACTVSGNTALRGGGISTQNGEITLRNGTRVDTNTALHPDPSVSAFGGGIYSENSDITIDASSVTANKAEGQNSQGGGINNSGRQLKVINGSRIEGNTAAAGGGGMFTFAAQVTIDVDSRVTANTAPGGQGGGIFNLNGTVTLATDQIVTNNNGGNCMSIGGTSPIANCNG